MFGKEEEQTRVDRSESHAIASASDVERLLAVAERHLRHITRSGSKRLTLVGDVRLHHDIVATMLSVAAVEAGLDSSISIPIL